ncbi:MAG: serine/threonine-protein kinase [Nitriliruptor sp.]
MSAAPDPRTPADEEPTVADGPATAATPLGRPTEVDVAPGGDAHAGVPTPRTGPPTSPILPTELAEGRYRITARLGVGGMGVVVRADDEVLGREVAIKLLADNLALDANSHARFLREARAAAAVSDPRVVAVYDVGEESGRPYLVMEYVDGPSLSEVIATGGPLAPDVVTDVARDALGALHAAHGAGLLHRDVKPGNLLRAQDGTVKVTDFGVAIAVDADRMTRTGFVIGTAGYLAPERRRGEPATVRTDLWALGATLTELVTGHPPGDEATAHLDALDEVPPRLRELLRRLLAEHPEGRPRDALAALEILADDPATSGAPTPPPPHRGSAATTELLHGPATSEAGGRPAPSHDRADDIAPARRATALRIGLLAALLLAALLVLDPFGLTGEQDAVSDEPFGPVMVDPDDPAASVRELARQLRERASTGNDVG